jgi:hypothetical protein
LRFIQYIKGKVFGCCRKKQNENPADRAARKTAIATAWIAVLTAVIGGIGIAQWIVFSDQLEAMRGQLDEMKSTGRQTDELIRANSNLAEAARKQADAAADTARISQDAFIANQRAWVGPKSARIVVRQKLSEPMAIIVDYQNTGRQPATNFESTVEVFTVTVEEFKDRLRKTADFMTKCMKRSDVGNGMVMYPTVESFAYHLRVPFDN